MKTTTTSAHTKTIRNMIAGLTLAATFFCTATASAQGVKFVDEAPIHSQTTDKFKVAVFPVANSLLLKVIFENPHKEMVTVLIKDSKDEVVYKKKVGRNTVFLGKFDVSHIADGTYMMVIQSAKQSYSNPFSIATQQERMARAL